MKSSWGIYLGGFVLESSQAASLLHSTRYPHVTSELYLPLVWFYLLLVALSQALSWILLEKFKNFRVTDEED